MKIKIIFYTLLAIVIALGVVDYNLYQSNKIEYRKRYVKTHLTLDSLKGIDSNLSVQMMVIREQVEMNNRILDTFDKYDSLTMIKQKNDIDIDSVENVIRSY